ncbi:hypothetical protein AB5I41_25915 [Sphingomonas sp. MMS24-JH45]
MRGVDFDLTYTLPVDRLFANREGNVTLRGLATRYIENLFDSGVPGTAVLDWSGVNGGQSTTPTWIFLRQRDLRHTRLLDLGGRPRGSSAGCYVANGIECSTACPANDPNFFHPHPHQPRLGVDADLLPLRRRCSSTARRAQFFVNVTNVFNRWPLLLPENGTRRQFDLFRPARPPVPRRHPDADPLARFGQARRRAGRR